MTLGGRFGTTALLVSPAVVLSVSVAFAHDSSAAATAELFTGSDLWRHGSFIYGGLLWSPEGLDRDGLTFKIIISGGAYRYTSGALGNATVRGRQAAGQVSAGWRFKWQRSELKVFVGPDYRSHELTPNDPSASLRGAKIGVRSAFEFWTEPDADSMLAINGSWSTISSRNYALQAQIGWRALESFYVGPEGLVNASENYRQYRLGLHVTGLRMHWTEWSAGSGIAFDSDNRSGAYLRVGASTRF